MTIVLCETILGIV